MTPLKKSAGAGAQLPRTLKAWTWPKWSAAPSVTVALQRGTCKATAIQRVPASELEYHVVAYDYGVKWNILRMLVERGCRVTVVPARPCC